MIALLLSMLSSTLLLVIFKYFERFKVDTLQAITVNYLTAAVLGMLVGGALPSVNHNWLPYALLLGFVFIGIFTIIAISSQKVGVAITAVANKMSLVIPVVAGAILMHEPLGFVRIGAIVLGLVAVVLVSFGNSADKVDGRYVFLPVILFFGSGFIDSVLNHVRATVVSEADTPVFSATIFLVAASLGSIAILYKRIRHGHTLQLNSVLGGIILGVPNYFSIHFLIDALRSAPGTIIFPVNNTGIVVLSTVVALLLFSERPTWRVWLGIALAIASIAILTA